MYVGAVQQTQSAEVVQQLRKLSTVSILSAKFDREQWRTKVVALLADFVTFCCRVFFVSAAFFFLLS